jgi:hypothetical protein
MFLASWPLEDSPRSLLTVPFKREKFPTPGGIFVELLAVFVGISMYVYILCLGFEVARFNVHDKIFKFIHLLLPE